MSHRRYLSKSSSTQKIKKSKDLEDYPSNSFTNSLPSPPYSEENFNDSSDEGEPVSQCGENEDYISIPKEPSNHLKFKCWNADQFQSERLQQTSSVSSRLSQIYPNLLKNVAGDESPAKQKPSKRRKLLTSGSSNVYCNVCNHSVNPSDLRKHLYFGPVKCKDCGWVEEYCPNFSTFDQAQAPKFSKDCPHHNLEWHCKPVANLKKWLSWCDETRDETEENIKKVLHEYIEKLVSLSKLYPWNKALSKCRKFTGTIVVEKPVSSAKSECETVSEISKKRVKKKKDVPTDTINLPEDGKYFIVRKAIEECPNCYEELDIERLKFNVETWLIEIICKECSLNIYFVLDPPDGSEPKIRILQY